MLEYVEDPAAVLRECARVLRPGGMLLCTVPDRGSPGALAGVAARSGPRGRRWLASRRAHWPRLALYLAYLRVSRQRRRLRWWHAAGRAGGFRPPPLAGQRASRAPLRLLRLHRPGGTRRARLRHHQGATVTTAVTIDMAGGQMGGAGRYRTELDEYLERSARDDIKVIGARRRLSPAWLAAREAAARGGAAGSR